MNEEQAIRVASNFLAEISEEFRTGEWVIVGTDEHQTAWSVGYQSRLFVETGRIVDSLVGNGPVVVPKSGDHPWTAWSARPVEEQIAQGRLQPAEDWTRPQMPLNAYRSGRTAVQRLIHLESAERAADSICD